MTSHSTTYESRLSAERAVFNNQLDIHDLPPIHHYWSNRHLRPKLEAFGFSTPDELFYKTLHRSSGAAGPLRFLSVGAGNCDTEMEVASRLRADGICNFTLECLDLNEAMLRRGRAKAEESGLGGNLEFQMADLNSWEPRRQYDAVIANQSLHHVVNLEHLFENLRRALSPGARFVISDMIGRNGHQRWPEARAIINEFWRRLPPSYRFNKALDRFEENFEDHDCSTQGFEGIRSQDVLPLLTEFFQFEFFFGFANLIDPFVDRQFGYNLDPCVLWVRRFIDEVHQCDETEQLAGRITPTHMLAVVTADRPRGELVSYPRTPREAVRDPQRTEEKTKAGVRSGYECDRWAYTLSEELAVLSRALAAAHQKLAANQMNAAEQRESLEKDLIERTSWALKLDQEAKRLAQLTQDLAQRITALEEELAGRTAWARGLDGRVRALESDLAAQVNRTDNLESELEGRTRWARSLEKIANDRTEWAHRLEDELAIERKAAEQLVRLPPRVRRAYEWAKPIWARLARRK